jgi:hypothetical protein
MGRESREARGDDESPIDVGSTVRAAKTAASLGRAPPAPATAKIGAFDLEEALAKSRAADEPEPLEPPAPAEPVARSEPPSLEPAPAPAIEPAKRADARLPMLVLAVLTVATLAFAVWAARSM